VFSGRNWHIGRRLNHARRYRHIAAVLMTYGFDEVLERLRHVSIFARMARKGDGEGETVRQKSRPQRVRMALEELGPTFIKLGQLLSTRPDLLPPEYIEQLSLLQDRVPPAKFSRIKAVVEAELAGGIKGNFSEFDPEPLAAGSIAQVHRAVTTDGREVVAKVCRPDVRETLEAECEMIIRIADWLGKTQSPAGTLDLPRMAREFTFAVSREVDMTVERNNLQRFTANFEGDPTVHVPETVESLCSECVLTMEYIDGTKPRSADRLRDAGLDPQLLARRGADFVLRQIFEFGVFHSDPHPGNMFMLPENIVVPIDFGQVARLRNGDQELLSELVLAIVDRDSETIVHALSSADLLSDETDGDALSADAEDLIDRYYHMPLKDIPLRDVISEVFRLIRNHQLQPPAQFTLMLKSLMTIESLAMELDPQFDIINALKPHARRFRLQRLDPRRLLRRVHSAVRDTAELVGRLPDDARAIIKKARKGDVQVRVHHEHLEELSSTLDKSSNRISLALIIAALLIASSMLTPQEGMVLKLVRLETLGVIGYIAAAIGGIWLGLSILRSRHF
jgi:ubiquinone biosynthesis protein